MCLIMACSIPSKLIGDVTKLTPFLPSPDHNSTALLVADKLYAGTAADYQVTYHRKFEEEKHKQTLGMFPSGVNKHLTKNTTKHKYNYQF